MSREILKQVAAELVEELVPIGINALRGIAAGKAPEEVLTQAERDTIAKYSQDAFDAALARGQGRPNTGE